ncbi:hypothetical protein ACO0QE_001431 [Hanseniaspora vineae]
MLVHKSFIQVVILLCYTAFLTNANPVTFKVSQKECVHVTTPEEGCRVVYYFAVQAGDNNEYEINYSIYGPESEQALATRDRERQGEWEFVAALGGEYSFCFEPSTSNSKRTIDFDVKYTCPNYIGNSKFTESFLKDASRHYNEEDTKMDNFLDTLDVKFNALEKNLEYYKTRNNRNQQTVESTERRIFWFSLSALTLTGLITVGQSYLLKYVFQRSRRNKV